ncbi:MAG: hypothetical protein SV966_05895 [Actinomycetota bacterium]|nr:hypothetical protein [Actinomycetota bacterium]
MASIPGFAALGGPTPASRLPTGGSARRATLLAGDQSKLLLGPAGAPLWSDATLAGR